MFILTEAQRQHWTEHGWLLLSHSLSLEVTQALSAWVEAMTRKARDREQRLHYYERMAQGKALCRVERFLDDHAQLRSLIIEGTLPMIAATLLGERAVIYKEKINCKHAGGAGYAPHQDAAAYRYVKHHVTCLVAVDAMTPDNGCLEFALGHPQRLLRRDGAGCIDPQIADKLEWIPVPVPAGGVLFLALTRRTVADRTAARTNAGRSISLITGHRKGICARRIIKTGIANWRRFTPIRLQAHRRASARSAIFSVNEQISTRGKPLLRCASAMTWVSNRACRCRAWRAIVTWCCRCSLQEHDRPQPRAAEDGYDKATVP